MKISGYRLYTLVTSSFNSDTRPEVCFARHIGPREFSKASYDLYIVSNGNAAIEGRSHYCFVSKHQIVNYIRSLKKIYPFKYSIRECIYKGYDTYRVRIRIEGTYAQRLFILTALRYTYEYPFNTTLCDALRLTKISNFKGINIISLINLVYYCIYNFDGNSNHAFNVYPGYASLKELHNNILKANLVFDVVPNTPKEKIERVSYKETVDSEYWDSSDMFEKRLLIYKQNLKSFIKK
jgi:hypothetical protein